MTIKFGVAKGIYEEKFLDTVHPRI